MQRRIGNSKFTGIWVISSLMVISITVAADGYYSQQYPQYSQQGKSQRPEHRQVNPWRLPEKNENSTEFQRYPDYPDQQVNEREQSQNDQQLDQQKKSFHFVTPDILESLKQQQSKYQKMPGSSPRYQSAQPWSGGYGYSPYGMGYTDPIFGVPGISPWGGPELLYRGAYPWAPTLGVGGIPATPVPSYNENSYTDESANTENPETYDVFDPYTLLPNRN